MTRFTLSVCMLLVLCITLDAQDIEAELSGNTAQQGFIVKDNSGNPLFNVRGMGRTGIGVLAPAASLHVGGTDGFLVTGSNNSGSIPATGAGTRMMFYPNKAAFRAGSVDGSQWDDANIGHYSIAMGLNTTASGQYSTAIGRITTASSFHSTAMGCSTTASGEYSTAMGNVTTASGKWSTALGGQFTTASGDYSTALGGYNTASGLSSTAMGFCTTASGVISTAMGDNTTASGKYSTAMGGGTVAESHSSTAVGQYNVGGGSATTWVATDPLLEIGNGTSASARHNAMTVLKNGNVGIGTATPAALLTTIGTGVNHGWGSSAISSTLGSSQGGCIELGGANATTHITNPVSGGTPYIDFHYGTGNAQDYNARIINEGDKVLNFEFDATLAVTMQKVGGEGRLGVNMSGTPQYTLYVNGSAAKPGGGNWSNPSDGRLKTVVGPYERGLEEILGLRPIRFRYTSGNARRMPADREEIGFIAQDVRPLFPESVSEGGDGYLDFNMHAVNVALVNAVRELNRRLEAERAEASAFRAKKNAEIAVLRGELSELRTIKSELAAIKALLGQKCQDGNAGHASIINDK